MEILLELILYPFVAKALSHIIKYIPNIVGIISMQSYSREVNFEGIINFRDLGGYRAKNNRTVAWRRLFRSGYLHPMTARDSLRLKEEFKLTSVIDLRRKKDDQQAKEKNLLDNAGIKYFNAPFISFSKEEQQFSFSRMGEAYLFRISHKEYGKSIISALEIIADSANHPLLFHCGAGKDRSGLVAAFTLSVLGVAEDDIIADYILSARHMQKLVVLMSNEPNIPDDIKNLPAWSWEATPEAMASLMSYLKREFGSAQGYLEACGTEPSLFDRLEKALLI